MSQPVLLIIGVGLCLFGWKIYRFSLHTLGLIGGATAGLLISLVVQGWFEIDQSHYLSATAGGILLGALAGFFLAKLMQTYMFFMLGASFGSLLAWLVLENLPRLPE